MPLLSFITYNLFISIIYSITYSIIAISGDEVRRDGTRVSNRTNNY